MWRTDPLRLAACLTLLALMVGVPARSAQAEDTPNAVEAVAGLERAVDAGDSSWENLYDVYTRAKEALDAEENPATKAEAEAAYLRIRKRLAEALARDHVPMNGWVMGIFAALLLWGGFAWCLRIAMKSTPQHELDEDETWPIRPEEP